jgi:hypothetical protein
MQQKSSTPSPTNTPSDAAALFGLGLNVFPLPYAAKAGYPWKRLQFSRLHPQDPDFGVAALCVGDCNLGVVCGITSGNLFVIDCETHETLMDHILALQARLIPVWAVRTARGGHLYLRCEEGEVDNIPTGTLRDAEIRGKNSYVVAPSSVHPSGMVYEWLICEGALPPVVSAERINWLRNKDGQAITLKITPNTIHRKIQWSRGLISPYSNLSKQTRDYVAQGHLLAEGTRNNRLFNAACDLLGNQYSFNEMVSLLAPIALRSGLPMNEIKATLHSAVSRPRTPARPLPANTTPPAAETTETATSPAWRRALMFATQRDWTGALGGNQRALFLALVERARLSRNEQAVFRASYRELADLARMSVNTVRRHLAAFQSVKKPLIFKVGEDHLSGATLWRFSDWVLQEGLRLETLPNAEIPEHWRIYAESLFNSDASERGAVGKSGMFLYRFMTQQKQPLTPNELAEGSRLSINQVNYALKRLLAYKLVRRVAAGWVADSFSDQRLGEITLTRGRGAARQRRHQNERELFAGRILFMARLQHEGRAFLEALVARNYAFHFLMLARQGNLSADEDVQAFLEEWRRGFMPKPQNQ